MVTGLLSWQGSYALDALVAESVLPLASVDTVVFGLPRYSCPYCLPTIDSGDIAILVSGWLHDLSAKGINLIKQVVNPLRKRFKCIIGFDQADPFQLDFSDEVMSSLDVILKVNGIYKDLDLYNYRVGSSSPDGCWIDKCEPRDGGYQNSNLEKLQVSVPCFVGEIAELRRKTRRFYCPSRLRRLLRAVGDFVIAPPKSPMTVSAPPRNTVHFYASLTHIQRQVAARMLTQARIRWIGGITSVPTGVAGLDGGMRMMAPVERDRLNQDLQREGLLAPRLNRLKYNRTILDSKAVLSITGYGEVCFRMAEAWKNRRVLVCQDLSHVKMLFPLEAGKNVVFCRPDLKDLVDILLDIETNFSKYIDIAERGYRDWTAWSRSPADILKKGFKPLF